MEGGKPFDIKPAGMLALDVARIEAGLLLIEVDFRSSKIALIESAFLDVFNEARVRVIAGGAWGFAATPTVTATSATPRVAASSRTEPERKPTRSVAIVVRR